MKSLIDKQTAIDLLTEYKNDMLHHFEMNCGIEQRRVNDCIELLKTLEPSVVCCEECRHGVHSGRGDTYLCIASPEELSEHKYDFFCGYGERREN